jgi:simple sugar transport system permease protein
MSLVDTAIAGAPAQTPVAAGKRSPRTVLSVVAASVVVFCAVRALLGADDLTSSGAIRAALQLAVPIGLAALGGLWSERAGVVNIGLEGMLIIGTLFGAWAGYQWGPWAGVLAGVVAGALAGLLHGLATVTLGVDHIVSGVAINILALGVGGVLGKAFFEGRPEASERQSPPVASPGSLSVPGLDNALDGLESRHWFLLSDLAGVLRGIFVGMSPLTLLALLLVPLTWLVLWRTGLGLRVRAVGESPAAAETLGVNVYLMKYVAVVISGGLAGLGGVYLVTVASNTYLEGQTGGRGYIGLAAMIFGNWMPGGAAAGALLFGYTDALRLRSNAGSVPALLVFAAVALGFLAVRELWRVHRLGGPAELARRLVPTAIWLFAVTVAGGGIALGVRLAAGWATTGVVVVALLLAAAAGSAAILVGRRSRAGALTLYLTGATLLAAATLSEVQVPGQFVGVTPNIATLVVLTFATQRLRMPAADGLAYRRGDAT